MSGVGLVWITSLGAIIRKDVSDTFLPLPHLFRAKLMFRNSSKQARNTSSTTGTSLPGTAITNSSASRAVVSSLT